VPVRLYNAWPEPGLRGEPGTVIATRDGAICRATVDGAVWITHLRPLEGGRRDLKLPAVQVLGPERLAGVPERPLDPFTRVVNGDTWQEIRAWNADGVGYLAFEFHNGAMSADQCRRLQAAWERLRQAPERVLVLLGGSDFWSNGIHLHRIEAEDNAAEASWDSIEAMNDLTRSIIDTEDRLVIAALRGNAGAGGVFLALAADAVWCAPGVVLNPHYKNMGNLYGSEYWTYLLPRRVGPDAARNIMRKPASGRCPGGTGGRPGRCGLWRRFGRFCGAGGAPGRGPRRRRWPRVATGGEAIAPPPRRGGKAAGRLPGGGDAAHAPELLRL